MGQDELRRLRSLLLKFHRARLDRPKRRPTFMEVDGVGRREVTISRILAFFLDSEEVHGMGDLWLKAFLAAASDSDGSLDSEGLQTSPSWCSTEVVTESDERNLRIDIVTQTPDLVLGIESKEAKGPVTDNAVAGPFGCNCKTLKAITKRLTTSTYTLTELADDQICPLRDRSSHMHCRPRRFLG